MVRPKKNLGQHFLTDKSIAQRITDALQAKDIETVVEIGPGTGVLTEFLVQRKQLDLYLIEFDTESVDYLNVHYPDLKEKILHRDFLQVQLNTISSAPMAIIGNFPYNISTQILFKILDNKNLVKEVIGMFQKEVADRIASGPGNKNYGIPSVLLQAYYKIDYLFTVNEDVFNPPPKVKSGVIRLVRNEVEKLPCDEVFFKSIVKSSFNQRRKTLRNSLKPFLNGKSSENKLFDKRPEQIGVDDFVFLANYLKE